MLNKQTGQYQYEYEKQWKCGSPIFEFRKSYKRPVTQKQAQTLRDKLIHGAVRGLEIHTLPSYIKIPS